MKAGFSKDRPVGLESNSELCLTESGEAILVSVWWISSELISRSTKVSNGVEINLLDQHENGETRRMRWESLARLREKTVTWWERGERAFEKGHESGERERESRHTIPRDELNLETKQQMKAEKKRKNEAFRQTNKQNEKRAAEFFKYFL